MLLLTDLEQYNPITIQCHDNPDADAIGSGYGLYRYFKDAGKEVRFIYSGRNRIKKSNLRLMVDKLQIPIEYLEQKTEEKIRGLLIMVDCQYGGGNVTRFEADRVAVIDHHQEEKNLPPLSRVQSNLGSCATLVWEMLREAEYPVEKDTVLGTALYYGLYTDTNRFSEISNPLDMDMREAVLYKKSLLSLFRNSNISLEELEIAGVALLRYIFNDDYGFAMIKVQPCDPNILGLISDFLIQVDRIKTCVVYNILPDGFKLSVRSCVKEVQASELAQYLTDGIGSGGGHVDKAGGFINKKQYDLKYPNLHSEAYIGNQMVKYFAYSKIIYAREYTPDLTGMLKYQKIKRPLGYVRADRILPVGTPITIRTLEGDVDMEVTEDLYLMIGIKGEVYPTSRKKFDYSYKILDGKYSLQECALNAEYVPTIKNRLTGEKTSVSQFAGKCIPTGKIFIYAKPLTCRVKIFTVWDEEKYMLGEVGDYLAVRCDDFQDIYIVEQNIFNSTYKRLAD